MFVPLPSITISWGGEGKKHAYHPYKLHNDPQILPKTQFMELKRLLSAIDYPHFSLRRRLDRKRVLELGGNAVVGEVVSIMKAFQPLVAFINEGGGERREPCTSTNAQFDLQQLEAQVKELEAQIAALTERKGSGGP